jgi:hypothetical protein
MIAGNAGTSNVESLAPLPIRQPGEGIDMANQKYLVRLVRPVFQAAYLEIEAGSEKEACSKAFQSAYRLPDEQWAGRFNPDDHLFDVHCVRCGETPEGHPFSLLDFPLYSILSTNETPYVRWEGNQPWMNYLSPLTVASQMSRWIEQLAQSRDGYYDEAIEEFEEMLRTWKGTDQKVVPLLPPEELRTRIGFVEGLLNAICLLKDLD